ncbi:MAG: HEAT repeat domain-containing protein [Methanotrichaceae archaeon]|nr:HEAT repeat domain-containing protein [Methanotrichaceae archaeon]
MDKALELIEKLGSSDDYFERQKAAWALVNLGEVAVDDVAGALEKGEFSDLRYKSAWVLGKIGCPRGVEPLCRAMLNDPDHVVREWCAAALEAVRSQDAVPALVLAMKRDSSKDVRLRAAVALRTLGAAEALSGLLGHAEPEIRGMAVTGLAKIGHRESLPDVARLLEDEEMEVRRRAAAFMGEVACDEGLSCLARALQDKESIVRSEALKALGKIKSEKACDLALQALKDQDWQVRYTAVTTLGEIGHNKALDALVEVIFGPDDEETRAWAAWSLGEIGDERAIEPLQRAYKTCPTEVMKKAKDSLVEVFGLEI